MRVGTDKLSIGLRAIADAHRRKILRLLSGKGSHHEGGPTGVTAGDLEQRIKLAQPTVSHHMKVLKYAGLISRTKHGTFVVYQRNEQAITRLVREFSEECEL